MDSAKSPGSIPMKAGLQDGQFYPNGVNIISAGTTGDPGDMCMFLQDSGDALGSSIKTLMQDLAKHGCTECGSCPLFFPADNNVADGPVTVNYVSRAEVCK